MKSLSVIPVLALLASGPAWAQDSLPDPARWPGAVNPAVTQDTIGSTICARGWTKTVRPDWHYTGEIKRRLLREFGYKRSTSQFYELDHLIPLELGGAPSDERNLWLEPVVRDDGWDATRKDQLENTMNHLVCSGKLPLAEAQREMADDWTVAYTKYVGR